MSYLRAFLDRWQLGVARFLDFACCMVACFWGAQTDSLMPLGLYLATSWSGTLWGVWKQADREDDIRMEAELLTWKKATAIVEALRIDEDRKRLYLGALREASLGAVRH